MMTVQEANGDNFANFFFDLLYNNVMLSVLIRIFFTISLTSRVQLHINLLNVAVQIILSSILQI